MPKLTIASLCLAFLCQAHALAVQVQPAAWHGDGRQTTDAQTRAAIEASLQDWLSFIEYVQEAQWASYDGEEHERKAHRVAEQLSVSLITFAVKACESANSITLNMSKQFSRPMFVIEDLLRMDPFEKHQLLFKLGDQSKTVAQLPNDEVAMFTVEQVRELVHFVEYARALDMDKLRVEAKMQPSNCPSCSQASLVNRAIAQFATKLRSEFSRAQESVGVCSQHCYQENHKEVEWHSETQGEGKCDWVHCTGCQECWSASHAAEVLAALAAERSVELTGPVAQLLSEQQHLNRVSSVRRYLEMSSDARVDLTGTCHPFCENMPGSWKHKCGWSQLSRYCGTCDLCVKGECSANCYNEDHVAMPWTTSQSGKGKCAWVHCKACQECQVEQHVEP